MRNAQGGIKHEIRACRWLQNMSLDCELWHDRDYLLLGKQIVLRGKSLLQYQARRVISILAFMSDETGQSAMKKDHRN